MKEEKSKLLQALEAKVKELTCGGMCIAYSGDDGSTLLLKLAADMKARILAVTFRSPRGQPWHFLHLRRHLCGRWGSRARR